MRAVARLGLLGLLAAGCAAPAPAPGIAIEGERVRVVVPSGEAGSFDGYGVFRRGEVTVRARIPAIESGGEDFSVVAEGEVRVLRFDGSRTVEEGPYRLVIYRNGRILTR